MLVVFDFFFPSNVCMKLLDLVTGRKKRKKKHALKHCKRVIFGSTVMKGFATLV